MLATRPSNCSNFYYIASIKHISSVPVKQKQPAEMVTSQKKTSAEWIIEQLNVENAKLLAFILVIGFIGYHGILHLRYGPDSCTWLLSSGRYKGDHEWQPYGCMLHQYSKTDARRCLRYLAFWGKYNSFAFIGDSRVEQLYEYFIGLLKTRPEVDSSFSSDHHMPNYTYMDSKLRLSVTYIWSEDVSKTMVEQFRTWQRADRPPSVVVASTGLRLLRTRNTTAPLLDQYKRNLTHLVQAIDSLAARNSQVLWKLMEPVEPSKLLDGFKMISNTDIDAYNRAAVEILTYSSAKLWHAARLVSLGGLGADGAQLARTALRHCAQILLNMHCNDHMNFNDGTCCAQPEPYTKLTAITFGLFLICCVVSAVSWTWRWSGSLQQRLGGYSLVTPPPAPRASPLAALARLGLIMAYFYLCDRTNFFMKENKYYSEWSFWLPVGYVCALGLFFTDDSRSNRVLHREQTAEWKGWMQLVLLAAHGTGAHKVLPIYMLLQALTSAYMFLTGYGHFYYLWKQTGGARVVRYLRVMFRYNFLAVLLCLAMNRPYQFYSYIPLVSFWYTLMFVIMSLPPHISGAGADRSYQYVYTALKIIGLLTIVTVLYMSEVFFQKIFVTRPWKALFVNSDDDIHQWWLQWKQDRYSMTFGIIFAFVYLAARRAAALDEAALPAGLAPGAALLALAALGCYAAFTLLCAGAAACDEVHSYVAFIPILGYVALRNISAALRRRHSTMFAWFGQITLELYASQSHIWLAADTHGVLVLIPGAPVLNLILTSYIFVCAAHELHKLTLIILPYAVPDDWKSLLRNVAVFVAVLVAIGIYDGMF